MEFDAVKLDAPICNEQSADYWRDRAQYQYETHSADISESRIMNPLVSAVNQATFMEDDPTEMSEAALVSMAKLGDSDAFVELSKLHSDRILRTTYRITRNWHDAEDALQDAMLRAFSHLKDFQEKSSFATWLTRIAINSALMVLRKKRGCYETPFDGVDDFGDNYERWEVKSPAENPESRLARKEREELLRHAILRLPQVLREVIELQQAGGYRAREIAQALGISVPAVKSRLSRARLTLRTALLPANVQSLVGGSNAREDELIDLSKVNLLRRSG
jgi:RNA polymerase sigma-70 factor, ECF subfamily